MLQHAQPPRSPRPAGVPRPPRYRLRQAAAFVAGAAVLLLVQKLAESGGRLGSAEVRKVLGSGFEWGNSRGPRSGSGSQLRTAGPEQGHAEV